MISLSEADPELHTVRSLVQRADGRERQRLESARYHLWQAFENQDVHAARRWVAATKAAVLSVKLDLPGEDAEELRALALEALERIEEGLS